MGLIPSVRKTSSDGRMDFEMLCKQAVSLGWEPESWPSLSLRKLDLNFRRKL